MSKVPIFFTYCKTSKEARGSYSFFEAQNEGLRNWTFLPIEVRKDFGSYCNLGLIRGRALLEVLRYEQYYYFYAKGVHWQENFFGPVGL